jgi:hypothetical protein
VVGSSTLFPHKEEWNAFVRLFFIVTNARKKQLKRRKDLFGLWFQRFQSMVSCSIAVELRGSWTIMVKGI